MRNFEAQKDGDVRLSNFKCLGQEAVAKLSSKLDKRASFNLKH